MFFEKDIKIIISFELLKYVKYLKKMKL